jgi:uncharacterized integral membrane protein
MQHESVDIDGPDEGGSGGPSIKLIALLLVAIAVAVFFFQNGATTSIHFLWIDVSWPVRSVIVISVIAGIALDRLATWQWRRARRRKEKQQED